VATAPFVLNSYNKQAKIKINISFKNITFFHALKTLGKSISSGIPWTIVKHFLVDLCCKLMSKNLK
jgi:hypothetical protein